ncbi:two-component system regulatory protein YycI [Bacillus sp. Marseille-Q3570]|uniref:two-component system regulatory protein YycI n=1 Tax=Bacillus sp. Marseille-Q3570 TaxID=2963522 RepID=UPI0021B7C50D|nr:two-component system regulatory protein YycI [Bacillus sp. Marseille-Q3570]
MDWKNIKTIFIFSFLILNVYLGTEYFEKINPEFDTIEEETLNKLVDKIDFEEDYPKIPKELYVVSGTATLFDEQSIEAFTDKNKNQEISVLADKVIHSKLKEPYPLSSHSDVKEQLQTFIKGYVPNADQYQYWKYDDNRKLHIFRQHQEEIPFYFNDSISQGNLTGLIEISVDEEEITSYSLTSMQIRKEEKIEKLITAEEALLVEAIPYGTKLQDIKPVYFTLITNGGWKVFVPSWHIVTEEQELMVDATDSSPIPLEKDEEEESEE